MALIECKNCGKMISDTTDKCIHCGADTKEEIKVENVDNTDVCLNCGASLEKDQMFCSKCGVERGRKSKLKCKECGTELSEDEAYCPKCGAKVNQTTKKVKDIINKTKKGTKSNKKIIIIAGAVVVVLLLIFAPMIIVSTSLSNGNYKTAYFFKIGSKEEIVRENEVAYICEDIVNSLKDPSSFELREAWYDDEDDSYVFSIGANNSYGAKIQNYWYYTYDEDDHEYQLWTTLSDFDEEKTYSWDDSSDIIEKVLKNAAKRVVKEIVRDDSLKLDDSICDNINQLFDEGKLKKIELLDVNKIPHEDKESNKV